MYNPSVVPGKMKHTFTGVRPEFPNYLVHEIIRAAIVPFRVELMRRPEAGGETQVTDSLRTYMLDNIQYIREQFQENAFTAVYDPDVTLTERKAKRDVYVNTVLDKSNTAEAQTRLESYTHSDEMLPAADSSVHSLTFDFTGLNDRDLAQPTPERVQNPLIRNTIIALDRIVVNMTVSHSADNPRTIIAQEAAAWITDVDGVYHMVDSFDPGKVPFHPTALSLNEKDTMFNADGTYDVEVGAGGTPGELDENTRVETPTRPITTAGLPDQT